MYLRREVVTANGPAFETHVPERWTSFIALAFAGAANGSSMTWHRAERERSEATRTFDPGHIDPNCVSTDIAGTYNWGVLLRRFADRASFENRSLATDGETRAWFHVDVHGRRDPEVSHETLGPGDVDIGVGALRADRPELADALAETLGSVSARFSQPCGDAFPEHEPAKRKGEKAFRVEPAGAPLCARARRRAHDPVAAERASRGSSCVQLELSLRLRLVLKDDPEKASSSARATSSRRCGRCSVETSKRVVEMSAPRANE